MKIMFAAPFSGARTSIFISNYYLSLQKQAQNLGYQTLLFDTHEAIAAPNVSTYVRKMYQPLSKVVDKFHLTTLLEFPTVARLRAQINDFRPDVLFVYVIQSRCLTPVVRYARSKGILTAMWVGLNPNVLSLGAREVLAEIDCLFTYDESYLQDFHALGCRTARRIALGIDVDAVNSIPAGKSKLDISFVGMMDDVRAGYLESLKNYDLGIWSWNFDTKYSTLSGCYRGEASGDVAISNMKAAKIGVNIHRPFEKSGGNFRLFEIPACCSLQLVDNKSGLSHYFDTDRELVIFDNVDDLREKVDFFLSNDSAREEIITAAYKRIARDHKLIDRFVEMMNALGNL